jgi:hypothetical protein
MAMNLRPSGGGRTSFNMGMSGGMPAGYQELLDRKYAQQGQEVAARAAQAYAAARLQSEQAKTMVPESQSRIGLNNANAFKTREEGGMVKPLGRAEINRIDAWIRASDQGARNQTVTTDANAGFVRSQTATEDLNRMYIPLEKRQALEKGEIDNKYLPGKYESDIRQGNSAANANNAQGRNLDADTRGRDTVIRPPGDQSLLAPQPGMPAAFAPNPALATLFGSRGQAAAIPNIRPNYPTPAAPVGSAMTTIMMPSLASAPAVAEMSAIPGMAPVIRREAAPSLLDEGYSFLRKPQLASLDGSFLDNPMRLKRGTARVPGKGSGDIKPALLEPGEAVLNKRAAGMIGRDKIAKANAKGNEMRSKENLSKVMQAIKMMGMA